MKLRSLKYLAFFTLPILSFISFNSHGFLTFLPMIEAFVLIPFLEVFFKPDTSNLNEEESKKLLNNRYFDLLVYATVPIQYGLLVYFFFSIGEPGLSLVDKIGRISAMGLMCGVIGINVAHELGHRSTKFEQFLSKSLLLTSLYMHFFIEHNRGHHKNVSTEDDPASSRYGENLYSFWFRSVIGSYLSAWKLELDRLKKKGLSIFSFRNEMLVFQSLQLILLASIVIAFGWIVALSFLEAAVMGFLLLETVNYIEHYGLQREKTKHGYERVLPAHSWNSDHVVGRTVLFELSRHSDHHFIANRKYQVLRHMDNSPQMPTGYPGMMILALLPPVWFSIMNPRIKQFKESLT